MEELKMENGRDRILELTEQHCGSMTTKPTRRFLINLSWDVRIFLLQPHSVPVHGVQTLTFLCTDFLFTAIVSVCVRVICVSLRKIVNNDGACSVYSVIITVSKLTRKLSYRKADRAMRPKYGCPENFRVSHGYFSEILNGRLFW